MASQNPLTTSNKEQKKETYSEMAGKHYNAQYEKWVPWLEDQYLSWFGKDNKASYVTKDTLDKSKVTGIDQVDHLQDGVNGLVSGQVGKGGIAQPIGDWASKEGVNRAERGGKDDKGQWAPGPLNSVANPVAENAKAAGSSVTDGAKSAGGYLGGMFGGKQDGKK